MILSIIIRGGGLFLNLFFSIYLSRAFSVIDVGEYFYILSLMMLITCVSSYGLDNAIIRDAARGVRTNYKLIGLFILILAVALSVILLSVLFDYKNGVQLCLAIVFYTLIKLYISFEKGSFRLNNAIVFESILPSITLFFITFFFSVPIISAVPISFFIIMILAFVQFKIRKCELPLLTIKNKGIGLVDIIRGNSSFFIIAFFNVIMMQLDTIMLAGLSNQEAVANYNLSIRFANVASVVLVFVNSYVGPRFSNLYSREKHADLKIIFRKSVFFCLVFSFVFFISIVFLSDYIGMLYSSDYTVSSLLIILSIGSSISLAFGPVATYLTMTKLEDKHRNTVVIALLVNCLSNFILIPIYGAEGAAISTIISILVKNILGVYYMQEYPRS